MNNNRSTTFFAHAIACAVVALLAACEGAAGPMGPPGEPGPGTRLTYDGMLDASGTAVARLPAEAGTLADPPAVTCYVSDSNTGPYIAIATDTYAGTTCGLARDAARNALAVAITGAPAGWYYRIVVIY